MVRDRPSTAVLIVCFALVWVVWGTTYLGIRIAIEGLPPLTMASARFLVGGAVLYGLARWRGAPPPTPRQWRNAAVLGLLLFVVGNGFVVVAEHSIPSSIAALLVGGEPLIVALLAWRRPHPIELAGMLVASVGVALLVGMPTEGVSGHLGGVILVLLGCIGWAVASVQGSRADLPRSSLQASGMQMMAGAVGLALFATARGEVFHLADYSYSTRSILAAVYLLIFGSLLAFTAYQVLVRSVSPAMVSTYAYVNPVVAVFAGALIADEPVTPRLIVAAATIVGGVFLMTAGPPILTRVRRALRDHRAQRAKRSAIVTSS